MGAGVPGEHRGGHELARCSPGEVCVLLRVCGIDDPTSRVPTSCPPRLGQFAGTSLAAGTTGYVSVGLSNQALALLAGAKDHTIYVTETLAVNGGATVTKRIALVS